MKILKGILYFFLGLFLLVLSLIWVVDRSEFENTSEYKEMMGKLDELELDHSKVGTQLLVGWAKENITPEFPSTIVGYRPRGPHESVNDSLFVRTMIFDNGNLEVAVVSIDLLLFPPLIKKKLTEKLPEIKMEIGQLYFSATHTHTSVGGWDDTIAGRFIAGSYNEKIVQLICDKIMSSIKKARENKSPGKLGFTKIDAGEFIENRLDKEQGEIDPWVRLIKIEKESGQTGTLISYSAHSTNISKKILILSGDYPGELNQNLEKSNKVDFSLFCSGMVGSHRPKGMALDSFKIVEHIGGKLAERVLENIDSVETDSTSLLAINSIPVSLPESQARVAQDFKIRDWAFDFLMGDLDADITILRLGNNLLLGMPCDFSGELYVENKLGAIANSKNLNLMITSFNGKYVGYITSDEHYNTKNREEVIFLNWVGPYKGKYFVDIIKKILDKV